MHNSFFPFGFHPFFQFFSICYEELNIVRLGLLPLILEEQIVTMNQACISSLMTF